MERWLPIPGFVGRYEVSDQGRVRSLLFRSNGGPQIMRSTTNYAGYHVITLGAERKQYRLHCLVLEAFVGPRPAGMQGCHNDSNKNNNALSNLRWDTPKGNIADRPPMAGEKNGRAKIKDSDLAIIKARRLTGETCTSIAADYGVSIARISQIVRT